MSIRRLNQQRPQEIISGVVLGLAMVVSLFCLAISLYAAAAGRTNDEVAYWAAGRQLLHRQNPYDRGAIWKLELDGGLPPSYPHPLMMRNIPPALLLSIPLAIPSPVASSIGWSALLLLGLWIGVAAETKRNGQRDNVAFVVGSLFGPALGCIYSGQTSALLLFGMVLFLGLESSWPFSAGLALWLCFLKPHLFAAFALVLLLWTVRKRSYRVLGGVAAATAISAALITLLDPSVWTQYLLMIRSEGIGGEINSGMGLALRQALPLHAMWIQYVPAIVGCIWATWFWDRHKKTWDWRRDGGLVALVSVVAAPYAMYTDQVVVLPALLYMAMRTSPALLACFAALSAATELCILEAGASSRVLLIGTPVWIGWYLLARRAEVPQLTDMAAAQTV